MIRSVFIDRSLGEKTIFKEVINNYIETTCPAHKGKDSEILRLRKFMRDYPKLSARGMITLKTSDFDNYRNQRLEQVKPGTVKRELNLLHSVIESVRKKLALHENPISDVKRPKVRDSRDVRFLDGEEESLMAALDNCRNPWVKPAVILALESAYERAKKRANLCHFNFHDLRHESISRIF